MSLLPIKGKVVGPRGFMPTFSELIEGFTYKPGYAFSLVHPDDPDLVFRAPEARWSNLYLQATVPDSTRFPHDPYTLQFQHGILHSVEYMGRSGQLYHLGKVLEMFELHERDEWFRVNGELVNPPHET